jgi:hypothetical protein
MADDQRPYRGNDVGTRSGQTRAAGASGNDPLAELARLIGQSDPFGEFARDSARRTGAAQEAEAAAPAAVTDPQDYGAPAYAQPTYAAPPAGADAAYPAEDQIPAYLTQQAQLGGKVGQVGQAGQFAAADGYGQDAYYQGKAPYQAGDEDYYDDAPPQRRRMGILVIAGVFARAVSGTAGACGYRALFGASGAAGQPPVIKAESAPSKIVPANTGKDTSKLITDRVGGSPQNEKLVSREEQPVAIKDKPAGVIFPPPGGLF